MRRNSSLILILISCMVFASAAFSGNLVNSKHDLSYNSTYGIGKATTTESCVFCHTPHAANSIAPFWNRNTSTLIFTMYSSDTMNTLHPGQPNNNSLVCSSCHDVHDDDISPFLRKSNSGSNLCYICHTK